MIRCHEIGHGFGLPHTDENFNNPDLGNCMDYTSRPQNNLHPDASNFARLRSMYGTFDGDGMTNTATTTGEEPGNDETSENLVDFGGGRRRRRTLQQQKEEQQSSDQLRRRRRRRTQKQEVASPLPLEVQERYLHVMDEFHKQGIATTTDSNSNGSWRQLHQEGDDENSSGRRGATTASYVRRLSTEYQLTVHILFKDEEIPTMN